MFDTTEQHLRSLDALGQDMNQRKTISLITNNLPNFSTIRSEQQKGTEKQGSAEMLPLSLKGYITTQEIAENQYQVHMKRMVVNREDKNHSKRKPLEQWAHVCQVRKIRSHYQNGSTANVLIKVMNAHCLNLEKAEKKIQRAVLSMSSSLSRDD